MNRIVPLLALGAGIVSLAACTGMPRSVTNAGSSGVTASRIGTSSPGFVNSCPASATGPSGEAWHPGEYCIPGGRKS